MNPTEYAGGLTRMFDYHSKTKEMFSEVIKNSVEEPIGPLCGKIVKVKPHIPYYLVEGSVVQKKWREAFVDRVGNKATLTKVEVITKKGKLVDYTIQVKWE